MVKTIMNFPQFGDADSYKDLGNDFHRWIKSGENPFGFESPLRPLGSILLSSLPVFITDDPVYRNYLILLINVAFMFIAVYSISGVLTTIFKDNEALSEKHISLFSFSLVLLYFIPHLPVRAMDIQPISLVLLSLKIMMETTTRINNDKPISYKNIFIILSLVSLAGLLKQSWFVFGLILILIMALDIRKELLIQILKEKRVYLYAIAGLWGLFLQVYYVYYNYGDVWLYSSESMEAYSAAWKYPNIALFAYTEPAHNAYLLKADSSVTYIEWIIVKLYFTVFVHDLAFYHGYIPYEYSVFYTNKTILSLMLLIELSLIGVLLATLFKGVSKVKLLSVFIIFIVLFMTWKSHVEIRNFIMPRMFIGILIVYWLVVMPSKLKLYKKQYVLPTIIILIVSITVINIYIKNQNETLGRSSLLSYLEKQVDYVKMYRLSEVGVNALAVDEGRMMEKLLEIKSRIYVKDNENKYVLSVLDVQNIIYENQSYIDGLQVK